MRKPNFSSVSVFKNPNRTKPKPKGQTRNFSFRGFPQNRTCLIQIVNIWAKAFKEVCSEIWYYIYTTQDSGMIGIIDKYNMI